MRSISMVLAILATVAFAHATYAQDSEKRSEEMQVLDRFVGTWDLVMTTKPNGRDATTRKTTETRQCSTGGKFIYFNNPGNEDPELQEFHMLLTYDSVKNTYPGMMMIGSSRYAIDATWDKATNTMTFRGISTEDGTTLVYQNRFIDSAHVETSGEVKNAGKVIMEQSIKQTRREK